MHLADMVHTTPPLRPQRSSHSQLLIVASVSYIGEGEALYPLEHRERTLGLRSGGPAQGDRCRPVGDTATLSALALPPGFRSPQRFHEIYSLKGSALR